MTRLIPPLEAWRREKGLTYHELAAFFGMSAVSVQAYCQGRKLPTAELIGHILTCTGGRIGPQELYDGWVMAQQGVKVKNLRGQGGANLLKITSGNP